MTASVGTKLGRYKILSAIGAGGMGEVFLGEDTRLGRKVALKILPQKFTVRQELLNRFQQEAIAISALNHPNIITIYEIGESDGINYIAVEYIEGKTLRECIIERSLNLANVLDAAIQVAQALSSAHRAGIIHRDIKPENIMIRRDNIVKVLDFGLAKLTERQNAGSDAADARKLVETNPGVLMGTMKYLSPEQARGKIVDNRSDIFSFGIVLYEMIAGKPPFEGESIPDIWAAILNQEPISIRSLTPDVPPDAEKIISKALRKNPEERYQTAEDLLSDLSGLRKRLDFETEFKREFSTTVITPATGTPTEILDADTFSSPDKLLNKNNLSDNFSPIVGREKEIAEIKKLMSQKETRILTLTGIGGTGKTTLAKAVARKALAEFADGVFFIELGAITNAELVASTIAQPLGLKEVAGKPILETLKDYLREKQILLVIDNFEQVLTAAPQIAELIDTAAGLKVLITSRALLRLSAEREYVVPPLGLPEDSADISLDELSKYEAIKLFAERARSAKANFILTEENARSVAFICSRLDGLPLAIELAAARVKILSPQAILPRLENRLKLLTGGARDLPARQQTMRGAVEWSYDLLDEDEKVLFRGLAVFAGGFTLEAAEAVCDCESLTIEVLDGISSLIDHSLLVQKEQPDGESRFRMLEVVREFALESLNSNGEAKAMRRRHAEYFLSLGEEAEKHLKGSESVKWLNLLEDEYDNLRAALRWSLANDAELAARLASAIRLFWFLHSHLTEGHSWLKAALDRGSNDISRDLRFKLLNVLGTLARFQGDYETAREVYEEGLASGRAANDLRQIAESSSGLGLVVFQQGDFAAAKKFIAEGLAISRELDDKFGIAAYLNSLGDIERAAGDDAAARPLFEEALSVSRQLGNKQFVSTILTNLGAVTYSESDFSAARKHFEEALEKAQDLGNRVAISYSLDGFAALAAGNGEAEIGTKLAAAAEQLRGSIGFEIEPADSRFREAYLSKLHAALPEESFTEAYEKGRKLKLEEAIALALG